MQAGPYYCVSVVVVVVVFIERVWTCLSLAPGSYFSELPRCGEGGFGDGGN